MSNRTALADKAIREAWKKEKDLVLEGKGTRDWTPEQQEDIVKRGKAYDTDGKAYEGHHMISVENNPELQGCSVNIQFLSKKEHLNAHDGNFQNPTNGYYDPETGETKIFENGIYEPCKPIALTNPIFKIDETPSANNNTLPIQNKSEQEEKEKPENGISKETKQKLEAEKGRNEFVNKTNISHNQSDGLAGVKAFFRGLGSWLYDNRETIARISGKALEMFIDYKTSELFDSEEDDDCNRKSSDSLNENIELVENHSLDDKEKVERASPIEHTVKASGQHYWINGERVWKDKPSYQRGGREDDSNDITKE